MPPRPQPLPGPHSREAFAAAKRRIPGGVNSPVRAFGRLGGRPPVISRGEGAWLIDVDGQRYVDYVLSWGPLLLGHAHPRVVAAVCKAAERGLSFGAPTKAETELATMICAAFPGMDQVRLVNSGTEACMSALRLARAATARELIIKCAGCYHGHSDQLLVAAGSGAATFGQPDSAGVPASFAARSIVVPYNDLDAVAAALADHPRQVAALIVEPVAGNMGLVLPEDGYLAGLRRLCDREGTLLVFDEVMTGFRCAWGGYQRSCGVRPDLTCLGKVIGGGLPVGAFGGRRELMRQLSPEGPCYQAGTLSGNPIAVAAGLATLRVAHGAGFYERVGRRCQRLVDGLRHAALRHRVPFQIARVGTMWGFFFRETPVRSFADAADSDMERWRLFVSTMMQHGVYLAPSPFEAAFFSSAHGPEEIRHTLQAAERAFAAAS